MKNVPVLLLIAFLATLTRPAHALNVFACEPEWGALAHELGGDQLNVYTATHALQDVHHIQARPSLIAKARTADLLICTGLGLEDGWLPMILRQAANNAIQPSKPGYFEAGNYVNPLEIPQRIDRSEGDVHARGNPHIHTDPRNILKVATALTQRLTELDPSNATFYQTRGHEFVQRWQAAIMQWETQAAPLKGIAVVTHHNAFPYLASWLGMKVVATLEPNPGVEPTSTHLAKVLTKLQQQPARMVIRTAYDPQRASVWLAERAKIPAVVLPFTVGGSERARNLTSLFDDTLQRLLEALK
ncbi:MAG: zinc ABC transporter substrate-binding protein [Methylophilaceae bacterium]|nr:zinc ABC transporter substrate-binding protein [Methylophilaceae bacterium]